ncbi:helix-turn-helix domain-containing protein [Actinoplanes sp. NPDC051851]|uniref:TetR/AcrR family transcriptional regulator n=1 Tax=Actinoplanes sp. NPDC051851 TaxID=3154753 RepID=UPI003443708B
MSVRERRRAALIAAARDLFLERGVDQVTIDDIADRCSVTRRTVYRYFATREQVALAVEVDILQRWAETVRHRSESWSGTGAARLATAFTDLEQLVDEAADEVRFTRIFDARSTSPPTEPSRKPGTQPESDAGHLPESDDSHGADSGKADTAVATALDEAYRQAIHGLLAPLVAVLHLGQEDGTLRLAVSPELTASTLTNAYLGLAQRVYGRGDQLAQEQQIYPRDMLTELARLYLTALRH